MTIGEYSSEASESSSVEKVPSGVENLHLKWDKVHPIGAGLRNMGNTCYLNSVLQCLTYTAPLANYLLSGEHSKTCHVSGFCMACTMENHINKVFAKTGDVVEPTEVLKVLNCIGAHFERRRQEDAHEFFSYTVAALSSSLPGNNVDSQTSFVDQIFSGCLRSRVTCLNCKAVSDTLEPYLDIGLDIMAATSLNTAFEEFVKPECLGEGDYKCSKCNKMVTATKSLSIQRNSNVLTISLKRFSPFSDTKITTIVRYPEELDLRPFMSESEGEPQIYSLYAVLVHSGTSCQFGHYYCYIKASNGQWYKMNDSSVSPCVVTTVLNDQAYLLFYIRTPDMRNVIDFSKTSQSQEKSSSLPSFSYKMHELPSEFGYPLFFEPELHLSPEWSNYIYYELISCHRFENPLLGGFFKKGMSCYGQRAKRVPLSFGFQQPSCSSPGSSKFFYVHPVSSGISTSSHGSKNPLLRSRKRKCGVSEEETSLEQPRAKRVALSSGPQQPSYSSPGSSSISKSSNGSENPLLRSRKRKCGVSEEETSLEQPRAKRVALSIGPQQPSYSSPGSSSISKSSNGSENPLLRSRKRKCDVSEEETSCEQPRAKRVLSSFGPGVENPLPERRKRKRVAEKAAKSRALLKPSKK